MAYQGSVVIASSPAASAGDMLASVYDPTSVVGDAFDRANHTGTQAASTIVVTTRYVGSSTDLDVFLANLDASQTAQKDSGFQAWSGAQDGTVTVTIATPGVFTKVGHGLVADDKVMLKTTGALPTGLAQNTTYFVLAAGLTADTFQLSLTSGGAAINTSGTQSGTHTLIVSSYSIAANQLTLIRPGSGFIKGKRITWAAGQTAAAFTAYAAHWIYIDETGTIGITNVRDDTLYQNIIPLFQVYYDGVGYEVSIENHGYDLDTALSHYLHESIGTILVPVSSADTIGADMVRVALGTGGAAGDRQIKIVGTADINDQGLHSTITDSGGNPISFLFYYTNALGQWVEYTPGTEFPMVYNNAGTPTALATTGGTDTGLFTVYAIKNNPNSGLVTYLAVMDDAVYGTDAAALAAIAAGTNAVVTDGIAQALEPAQLGHVIVTNNGTGGFISTVNISKSTARSGLTGGGSTSASGIATNTAGFDGTLSASDTTVQAALDTLNKLGKRGAALASATTTDLSTTTGHFVHITGTTTITALGTLPAGNHRTLVFDAALTLTHNATSLILPGGANITTAAGDAAIFKSEGAGNWRCVSYVKADGSAISGLVNIVEDTTPQLGGDLDTNSFAVDESKGSDIPSAGSIDLGAIAGNFADITGTTTITALGTANAGIRRIVRFTGALTLTHNATSLILPTGANITTAAGDTATFVSLGSGNWVCVSYTKADGSALLGVTPDGTQTLNNKRINPRTDTIASSATPTPNGDTTDEFTVTALAAGATFAAPTGTPVNGQTLVIRIKDNAAAQTLAWNAIYRASTDLALPTTTVISKTMYLQFIYNSTDSKWDLVGFLDNF